MESFRRRKFKFFFSLISYYKIVSTRNGSFAVKLDATDRRHVAGENVQTLTGAHVPSPGKNSNIFRFDDPRLLILGKDNLLYSMMEPRNAIHRTVDVCPSKVNKHCPVAVSQTRAVLSVDPLMINWPSDYFSDQSMGVPTTTIWLAIGLENPEMAVAQWLPI
uniref:Uncharacterized protein n=1 Tax=Romanomermis culicivorax TaxID=13658 RepID=A0A915KHE6_ROMCU